MLGTAVWKERDDRRKRALDLPDGSRWHIGERRFFVVEGSGPTAGKPLGQFTTRFRR